MKSEMEKEIPTDETCRDVTLLARLMENMKNYVERDLKLVTHVYKKVVSLDYQDIVHRQIGDLVRIILFFIYFEKKVCSYNCSSFLL